MLETSRSKNVKRNWYRIFDYSIIIFFFVLIGVYAQEDEKRFKHLTIEDGLSQSTIYSIFQDSRGFMWFGTEDGLNKYDGYDFKIYNYDPDDPNDLSYNYVSSIEEDQDGNLWFATYGGGLNKFDPKTNLFQHYHHDSNDSASLSHEFINIIYLDHHGILWVGTDGGGLNQLNSQTGKFIQYRHNEDISTSLSHNTVKSILQDSRDRLWVGTSQGLNLLDKKNHKFRKISLPGKKNDLLSNGSITALLEDRNHWLWIGTDDGLYRMASDLSSCQQYSHDINDPSSLSNNVVHTIYQNTAGTIFIGTEEGLNIWDPSNDTFVHYKHDPINTTSLSDSRVYSIYETAQGVLWVGTHVGLSKHDGGLKPFALFRNDPYDHTTLSDNFVRSLFEDKRGKIWVGTYGGISILNRKNHQFRQMQFDPEYPNRSISSNKIMTILEDHNGLFWIGTADSGLDRYDPASKKFTRYRFNPEDSMSLSTNKIRVVYQGRNGLIWVGTVNGLHRYDPQQDGFVRYQHDPDQTGSLSDNFVYCIHEDSRGHLWVGTLNGLNRLDLGKDIFTHYYADPKIPGRLSSHEILSIYESKSGILWLGTPGGLNSYDYKSDSFAYYTEKDGLPNNLVYVILEDENGHLWVSTNKGISKFDPKTHTFKNYNVQDGLQSNEFTLGAAYKCRSGEMLMGGVNGFNIFHPDSIRDNKDMPRVIITDFKILNQSVPINQTFRGRTILEKDISHTNQIRLSHRDDVFSFEFTALNYINTEKNQYAYIMEGFEKEWNYIKSRRYANYTNLPAGDYTFRVKGSNNDGVWNEEGASVQVKVIPPFWNTSLFRIFAIVFILGLLIAMYKVRTNTIRKRNRELEKGIEQRTSDLENVNQSLKKEILDRKKTERKIRQLKNFHESIVQNMTEGIVVDDEEGQITFVNSALCDLLGYTEQELIGQNYLLYVPPDQLYIVQEADNRRMKGIADSYAVQMLRKDGKRIHVLLSGSPIIEGKEFKGTLAVFTDISKQKQAELEARGWAAQASLIYETGQRLSSELDLDTLLSEIVLAVLDAFDYYGVMVMMVHPSTKKLVLQAISGGYAKVFPKDLSLDLGEGMIGTAALTGKTQISNEITCNPNYIQKANEITQSELCVPLKLGNQIIGVLDVQSDRVNAFQEIDVAAIETLSTQIASAIRNARLYEKAQSELAHRKKIEKELKAKEITLRELFHNMSSGAAVFHADKNGRDFIFMDINSAVEGMENVNKADVVGQSILSVFSGETGQDLLAKFHQVWKTGKAEKCSISTYNKKMLKSFKEHYVYKLPSGEIVDIYDDSTQRKKAEQDIKSSEKKYRKLFNGVADPVIIFDKKSHRFLDCNKAVTRVYGYSMEEIRSMTPFDLHPPEELEKVKENIDVRNVDQGYTYTHLTRNGQRMTVEIHSDEMIYEDHPAWISIIRDITERKMLEDQLKEFAYIVSHDLKAPLRGVSQLATWLHQDYAESVDEEGREKFDLLLGRVNRMNNLIDGILQYSRAGRGIQEMEEIDLDRIVPMIIRDLAPPNHLKVKVENKLPCIVAEPVKIEQVFQNLISNAIKYHDKKPGEVTIGSHSENGHWKFFIKDNGPGIEKRYHERIFKIFQTLESRDTRESTGVGLSVVKKIIENNGGRIWIESKVGQGSTFYFTYRDNKEK